MTALRRTCAAVLLGPALLAIASAARSLPGDAQFAADAQFSYPYVKAGKQTLRLAVGARIYSEQNLIIMPAAVPAKANVLFKTDINGEVSRVWILSDEETKTRQDK